MTRSRGLRGAIRSDIGHCGPFFRHRELVGDEFPAVRNFCRRADFQGFFNGLLAQCFGLTTTFHDILGHGHFLPIRIAAELNPATSNFESRYL